MITKKAYGSRSTLRGSAVIFREHYKRKGREKAVGHSKKNRNRNGTSSRQQLAIHNKEVKRLIASFSR